MKSLALRWLLVSLAVIGLVLAGLVIFDVANRDNIMMTAWYILLADVYIVASLASKDLWIRWSIWSLTAVTTVYSIIYTWQDFGNRWEHWTESTQEITTLGFMSNVNMTLHTGIVTLVVIAFLTRAYPYLASQVWLKGIYWVTVGAALIAWLLWSIQSFTYDSYQSPTHTAAIAITILAATFAAVVIIGAIALGTKVRAERKARTDLDDVELRALVHAMVDERLRELGITQPDAAQDPTLR